MNHARSPRLSIGLPVFNGENFLEEALDSILTQDYRDFELIICDNASTDGTEAICRAYMQKDERIRYFKNPENIGAAGNWNRVFDLSCGNYFKWIAHDDRHDPEFLSKCIGVLDSNPSVVLAFTRAITIDSGGRFIREWGTNPEVCAAETRTRFSRWLAAAEDPLPLPIFGVIRAAVLGRTRKFMGYPEADIALLAELSLHGAFAEVPEALFMQREHNQRAGPKLSRNPHKAALWWNPRKDQRLYFPYWSLFAGYLGLLSTASLGSRQRWDCFLVLCAWARRHLAKLSGDIVAAAVQLPAVGPVLEKLTGKIYARYWDFKVSLVAQDLRILMPESAEYILVDDGAFGAGISSSQHVRPFLEGKDGYAGPPSDDETAINELERMRKEGAAYLAIGWPCFWWLTYYRGFVDHLNRNFERVLENDRLVVFSLRS